MQTRERRAKEATSTMAVCRRILIRISEGIDEIGHGGGGDASVGGCATGIGREEKEAMSCDIDDAGAPSTEWWAGWDTVTAALDGFGLGGFGLNEEGGKCLFL